jgi:hypothetical protein
MTQKIQFAIGDRVELVYSFTLTMDEASKKAFAGVLIVIGERDGLIRLSNGKYTGLCRMTCNARYLRKA